jgi:hypothetical protein
MIRISELTEVVEKYNGDLIDGEEPMTTDEMAKILDVDIAIEPDDCQAFVVGMAAERGGLTDCVCYGQFVNGWVKFSNEPVGYRVEYGRVVSMA